PRSRTAGCRRGIEPSAVSRAPGAAVGNRGRRGGTEKRRIAGVAHRPGHVRASDRRRYRATGPDRDRDWRERRYLVVGIGDIHAAAAGAASAARDSRAADLHPTRATAAAAAAGEQSHAGGPEAGGARRVGVAGVDVELPARKYRQAVNVRRAVSFEPAD